MMSSFLPSENVELVAGIPPDCCVPSSMTTSAGVVASLLRTPVTTVPAHIAGSRSFVKIEVSQSQRRSLLGPFLCRKCLIKLSHLRHY